MPTNPSFERLLDIAVDTRCQQYIIDTCNSNPKVVAWIQHFLDKSVNCGILEYTNNHPSFRNTDLAIKIAGSTGRLIAAETRLSHNWQDTIALFKTLLTIALCAPSAELAYTLCCVGSEFYRNLCDPSGRVLVATAGNKPVYMELPVFDMVQPGTKQPYVDILRDRCSCSAETPSHKLAQSFNAALNRAILLLLSFSWVFFDDFTIPLIPARLIGAKILLLPSIKFPAKSPFWDDDKHVVRSAPLLPLSGTSIHTPDNDIGVTKITLWQRDQWTVALLAHGDSGSSIVIASETIGSHLSLWRLLAEKGDPITADPLADLTFTTYGSLYQRADL